MTIEERNALASTYIRKCNARNRRRHNQRLKKIQKFLTTAYYGGAMICAIFAFKLALDVIGK